VLQFLLSDIFPEVINHKIVKPVFAVVVAILFIAPQVRTECCIHHVRWCGTTVVPRDLDESGWTCLHAAGLKFDVTQPLHMLTKVQV
jgi:hypothetical protein